MTDRIVHGLDGRPRIRGTRVLVERLVGLIEAGWSEEEVLEALPYLSLEDIRAAAAFQRRAILARVVFPARGQAELVGSGVDPRAIVLAAEGGATLQDILERWTHLTTDQVRLVLRLKEAILRHDP